MSSIKHQFNQVMRSKKRFGQKKHIEKKITGKTEGIHSYKTYTQYLNSVMKFADYIQKNHSEIKSIKQITNEHAHEYLEHLYKEHDLRPTTIQTYAAAIGKVTGMSIDKFNYNLPTKCSIEPQKGRIGNTQHINIYKHEDLTDFTKNTGCRRCEAQSITPHQIRIDERGNVFLDFKENRDWQKQTKGGRPRIITKIPKQYQETLIRIKETAMENNYKTIFENKTNNTFNKIGLHQYRRDYAQNLYKSMSEDYKKLNGYYPKRDYICRSKHAGESYNRRILKEISEQLGHSRVDVVINNYFR